MAHVLRPLARLPRLHHQCHCSAGAFYYFLTSCSLPSAETTAKFPHQLLLINSSPLVSARNLHFRTRALKLRQLPLPSDTTESDSDSSDDGSAKKSRNEKKREAKRAVRWGMELANFSPPQIKRILRVASLEREVYDALMLVKRLGRDVREGKRRQFNYIGRLLREVEPELMDGLIQATKDGDNGKFQTLCGPEAQAIEDSDDTAEETEDECEDDPEYCIEITTRWFEGLIKKDIDVMNEIYSLDSVDFDRQELRRLVRKVHVMQEHQVSSESEEKGEEVEAKVVGAKRRLTRFLRSLGFVESEEAVDCL
ncbi:uncharacterized protein [Coffea arabica]|uniref:Uncharacterized protein isoform X1 n=1 Tax=Coffea arabica TaxID=13443 RepID=A0ABM4W1V2_COFAR